MSDNCSQLGAEGRSTAARRREPGHVAVDETVIQLNDEQFWLYAAVDPSTNRMLHVKLSPMRNQAITEIFISELHEKHLVADALFLVDSAP